MDDNLDGGLGCMMVVKMARRQAVKGGRWFCVGGSANGFETGEASGAIVFGEPGAMQ